MESAFVLGDIASIFLAKIYWIHLYEIIVPSRLYWLL